MCLYVSFSLNPWSLYIVSVWKHSDWSWLIIAADVICEKPLTLQHSELVPLGCKLYCIYASGLVFWRLSLFSWRKGETFGFKIDGSLIIAVVFVYRIVTQKRRVNCNKRTSALFPRKHWEFSWINIWKFLVQSEELCVMCQKFGLCAHFQTHTVTST